MSFETWSPRPNLNVTLNNKGLKLDYSFSRTEYSETCKSNDARTRTYTQPSTYKFSKVYNVRDCTLNFSPAFFSSPWTLEKDLTMFITPNPYLTINSLVAASSTDFSHKKNLRRQTIISLVLTVRQQFRVRSTHNSHRVRLRSHPPLPEHTFIHDRGQPRHTRNVSVRSPKYILVNYK